MQRLAHPQTQSASSMHFPNAVSGLPMIGIPLGQPVHLAANDADPLRGQGYSYEHLPIALSHLTEQK
jgi:hypothetical protein